MIDFYAEIAVELSLIADDLATLAGRGLPKPWFNLSIQPHGDTDDQVVTAVDTVAGVLLGRAGKARALSSGSFHHDASGNRGLIRIGVYNAVSDPAARERDAELARLRAEVAALRGTDQPVPMPLVIVRDEMAGLLAGPVVL